MHLMFCCRNNAIITFISWTENCIAKMYINFTCLEQCHEKIISLTYQLPWKAIFNIREHLSLEFQTLILVDIQKKFFLRIKNKKFYIKNMNDTIHLHESIIVAHLEYEYRMRTSHYIWFNLPCCESMIICACSHKGNINN